MKYICYEKATYNKSNAFSSNPQLSAFLKLSRRKNFRKYRDLTIRKWVLFQFYLNLYIVRLGYCGRGMPATLQQRHLTIRTVSAASSAAWHVRLCDDSKHRTSYPVTTLTSYFVARHSGLWLKISSVKSRCLASRCSVPIPLYNRS